MRKHTNIIVIAIFFILGLFSVSFSQESITITTYYPSPYGSYNQLYVANNVGIGTTGPGQLLHVYGSAASFKGIKIENPLNNAAAEAGIILANNNGESGKIYQLSGFGSPGNGLIINNLQQNSNIQMRVNIGGTETTALAIRGSSGNVGIGTASPTLGKLEVVGINGITLSSSNGYGRLARMYESAGDGQFELYQGTNPTTKKVHITSYGNTYFNAGGTGNVGIGTPSPNYKLHLIGSAAKTVGGTAWVDASDARLKNVLGEIGPVLDKVKQLRPIRYTWNELRKKKFGTSDEGIKYGFVAQEIKNVFPEFISEGSEGYLMYNPSGYEAILTEAIQDLIKEIEELKSEVNVLKAKLSSSAL